MLIKKVRKPNKGQSFINRNNHIGIEKFKTYDKQHSNKYYDDVNVLDSDKENVPHMIRYFKGLSLKAIKRDISDFERTILGLIGKEFVQYKDIGVIASLHQCLRE